MKLEELKNDIEAEKFLIEIGVLNIKEECPYCGSNEVYSIRRNHFKCKNCRREWSKYNGTIFKDIRIKP
ncbi:transposase [Marinitoga lauensis]|uniref:transposase n=1 Tax=Marinitoga lauensis TaxID=2201189 RepID=UPI00101201B2|nr:transposase [Marinitoga lauensis]